MQGRCGERWRDRPRLLVRDQRSGGLRIAAACREGGAGATPANRRPALLSDVVAALPDGCGDALGLGTTIRPWGRRQSTRSGAGGDSRRAVEARVLNVRNGGRRHRRTARHAGVDIGSHDCRRDGDGASTALKDLGSGAPPSADDNSLVTITLRVSNRGTPMAAIAEGDVPTLHGAGRQRRRRTGRR